MLLSDFISPDSVVPLLKAKTKKQLLQDLSVRAARLTGLSERDIFDVLWQRERLGSTGLGQGIAIPHGRIKGLKEAVGAIVRMKQPIPFDAPDGQPVNLIFVLLVPDRATDLHLQILSELAQMFSDKPFRERLLAGATSSAVHQLISEWQPHAASQHSPVV